MGGIVSRETIDRAPLTAEGFRALTGASDAEVRRLARYLDLLGRWQRRINLVGAATLADPWRRHMLDSAQLLPLLPAGARTLLDMGSGAGFPGLVLAILGRPGGPQAHLVEANRRKCAFLNEVNRETDAGAVIQARRLDELDPAPYDVITARALAPLDRLLEHARPFLAEHTVCLFLKGRKAKEELTVASKRWKMRLTALPSRSDPSGTILKVEDIARRHG